MYDKSSESYFVFIKSFFMIVVLFYLIISNSVETEESIGLKIIFWLILSSASIVYNFIPQPQVKLALLLAGVGLNILLISLLSHSFCFILPFMLLDFLSSIKLKSPSYLLVFIGLFVLEENQMLYVVICICAICLYYQHYFVIKKYENYLENLLNQELLLKGSIDRQKSKHKRDIENFSLIYENKRLEEKSRLSQALHDKIGHSINGSVFQLEASKLLIHKDPKESERIISEVITSLRGSMDEIRLILRKEKPSPSEVGLSHIKKACSDFKQKYSIDTSFICEGPVERVPLPIWSLFLDNITEAFSNALKYSKCSSISVEIFVYHKFVRCTIKDNGMGCPKLKEGMGISGMKERVYAASGILSINSEIGFEINMIIPIKEEENNG